MPVYHCWHTTCQCIIVDIQHASVSLLTYNMPMYHCWHTTWQWIIVDIQNASVSLWYKYIISYIILVLIPSHQGWHTTGNFSSVGGYGFIIFWKLKKIRVSSPSYFLWRHFQYGCSQSSLLIQESVFCGLNHFLIFFLKIRGFHIHQSFWVNDSYVVGITIKTCFSLKFNFITT